MELIGQINLLLVIFTNKKKKIRDLYSFCLKTSNWHGFQNICDKWILFDDLQVNDAVTHASDDKNVTTRCRQGKHSLVLAEEVGIKCIYCSLIEVEIRYVSPPMVSIARLYSTNCVANLCLFLTLNELACLLDF